MGQDMTHYDAVNPKRVRYEDRRNSCAQKDSRYKLELRQTLIQ